VSLDADTALEPVGEGRWRGEVSERWRAERGAFGGFVSALLTRAMQEAIADPARPPRTLAVHFLEAPAAGPVEVSATVERAGRSTTALSLRMEQAGRPVALALGACAAWREGEPEWADGRPPEVAPPEDCPPITREGGLPPFVENFEIRWAGGGFPGRPGREGRNAAWMRPAPPEPLDHVAMTALSDGWMPAAFSKLGRLAIVPTLDLTIHFRAPAPVDAEWLLAVYSTRFSAGGAWEEDGELWTPDGRLVAQSRQLAMIRERS
jgi:acyl-CoA thioesterase